MSPRNSEMCRAFEYHRAVVQEMKREISSISANLNLLVEQCRNCPFRTNQPVCCQPTK